MIFTGVRIRSREMSKRRQGSGSNSGWHLVLCSSSEATEKDWLGSNTSYLNETKGCVPSRNYRFPSNVTYHFHLWP